MACNGALRCTAADRRLPDSVRQHEVLWGECIAGALYIEDFKRICADVGFADVRVLESSPIAVTDPELREICGAANFYSITYRCFKLPQLETLCEDYGQSTAMCPGRGRVGDGRGS